MMLRTINKRLHNEKVFQAALNGIKLEPIGVTQPKNQIEFSDKEKAKMDQLLLEAKARKLEEFKKRGN